MVKKLRTFLQEEDTFLPQKATKNELYANTVVASMTR